MNRLEVQLTPYNNGLLLCGRLRRAESVSDAAIPSSQAARWTSSIDSLRPFVSSIWSSYEAVSVGWIVQKGSKQVSAI